MASSSCFLTPVVSSTAASRCWVSVATWLNKTCSWAHLACNCSLDFETWVESSSSLTSLACMSLLNEAIWVRKFVSMKAIASLASCRSTICFSSCVFEISWAFELLSGIVDPYWSSFVVGPVIVDGWEPWICATSRALSSSTIRRRSRFFSFSQCSFSFVIWLSNFSSSSTFSLYCFASIMKFCCKSLHSWSFSSRLRRR